MRLVTFPAGRIAPRRRALLAAALVALAPAVHAQTLADVAGAPAAMMSAAFGPADVVPATLLAPGDARLTSAALMPATLSLAMPPAATPAATDAPLAAWRVEAAEAVDSADGDNDAVVAGGGALDDQTLSRQRGGAVGMVMVAATPQLMRGGSVTLWDEIAPPAPLPVPVDSAQQSMQGNVASYTRK